VTLKVFYFVVDSCQSNTDRSAWFDKGCCRYVFFLLFFSQIYKDSYYHFPFFE